MIVDLDNELQEWLEREVRAGNLPSVEDGVRLALTDMKNIADDDLAWAKPYVDAARASVACGDTHDGETILQNSKNELLAKREWQRSSFPLRLAKTFAISMII